MDKFEAKLTSLMRRYTMLHSELRKWFEELSVSDSSEMAYQFEWTDGRFETAARARAHQIVLTDFDSMLSRGMTPEEAMDAAKKMVHREVLNAARWPSRTTSVSTNAMKTYYGSAWVEILEDLEEIF